MVEEVKSRGAFLIPRSPWGVFFEGLGILALGVVLVAWPGATVRVILLAFGIFAIVFGAVQIFSAVSEERESKWWGIPLAVVSIAAGIVALVWPNATERIVLIIVGAWFVVTGFILVLGGFKLPGDISAKWIVVVVGLIALGFGIYLIVRPEDTSPDQVASTVVRLIGIFAIIEGVLITFYSFLLRKVVKRVEA